MDCSRPSSSVLHYLLEANIRLTGGKISIQVLPLQLYKASLRARWGKQETKRKYILCAIPATCVGSGRIFPSKKKNGFKCARKMQFRGLVFGDLVVYIHCAERLSYLHFVVDLYSFLNFPFLSILILILLLNIPGSFSLIAQLVKNPPAMQESPAQFLGQDASLEEG